VRSCAYYIADQDNRELILYKENMGREEVVNDRKVALSDEFFMDSYSPKRSFFLGDSLYLPLMIKGKCIGFIMVNRKMNGVRKNAFPESDIFFLKLIAEKASTQIENRMLYESLFESVLHTLTSLISAINKRDLYTEGHCKRVTSTSLKLAKALSVTEYEEDVIRVVGPIHDLGKVGVPDSILLKSGKLTDEEYAIMKDHSGMARRY